MGQCDKQVNERCGKQRGHANTTYLQRRLRTRIRNGRRLELKNKIFVVIRATTRLVPHRVVVLADGLGLLCSVFLLIHKSTVARNFYIAVAGPGSSWVKFSIDSINIGSRKHCQEHWLVSFRFVGFDARRPLVSGTSGWGFRGRCWAGRDMTAAAIC